MDELFPRMLDSLSNAVSRIESELAKLFAADRKTLADEQWTEYGDNLENLQYRLQQLNTILHFEFEFGENLANDVINYSKLLVESRTACEELVGFLLSRPDEPWTRDETAFLKEILDGIVVHSDRISNLLK
jgi:hypothetical protein